MKISIQEEAETVVHRRPVVVLPMVFQTHAMRCVSDHRPDILGLAEHPRASNPHSMAGRQTRGLRVVRHTPAPVYYPLLAPPGNGIGPRNPIPPGINVEWVDVAQRDRTHGVPEKKRPRVRERQVASDHTPDHRRGLVPLKQRLALNKLPIRTAVIATVVV